MRLNTKNVMVMTFTIQLQSIGIVSNVMVASIICYTEQLPCDKEEQKLLLLLAAMYYHFVKSDCLEESTLLTSSQLLTFIFSLLPSVVFLSLVKKPEQKYLFLRTNILYLLGFICDALLHCLSKPETRRHVRLIYRVWNETKKFKKERQNVNNT